VTQEAVRSTLYSAFGQRQVATIYLPTDSYRVILEVDPELKKDESALNTLFVRSSTGALVPLSAVARSSERWGHRPLITWVSCRR